MLPRSPPLLVVFIFITGILSAGQPPIAADLQTGVNTNDLTLPGCHPLQPGEGNNIHVYPDQASQLQRILDSAQTGDSILLEDGVYQLQDHSLLVAKPGITIRSSSGDPRAVVFDGGYTSRQIITVAASDVTIAEFTIRRAFTHALHIISSSKGNTENVLIYRMIIQDPREQAIKVNPHQPGFFVDNGTVSCSILEMTGQGRSRVNPTEGGCYTGGIDAHQASGWRVADNLIRGFWCPQGLSEHAIHFWTGSRNTLIERNRLFDNARAIGLGLKSRGKSRTYADNACATEPGTYIGHYGGIVRNNMIQASARGLFDSAAGFDCGICLWSSCNTLVAHNSIVSSGPLFSAIEWRFPAARGIRIFNNLSSHDWRQRDGASAQLNGNLNRVDLSLFVDAENGDLHLSSRAGIAIDGGVRMDAGLVDHDIDFERRDETPDIGADEI